MSISTTTTIDEANAYLNGKKSWNDAATQYNATYSESTTAVTCQTKLVSLFFRCLTFAKPKGVVILHHGLGYCSEMFAAVAHNFASMQMDVYAYDTVGHGKSGSLQTTKSDKPDAYVPQFQALVDCGFGFLAHVATASPKGVPMFLFGESMGGATVLEMVIHDLLLHYPMIKGIMLEGPAVMVQGAPNVLLTPLVRGMCYLFGTSCVSVTVSDDTQLKEQVEHRKAIQECVESVPLATIQMLLDLGDDIVANAAKINVPAIIIQGEADKVVKPQGAQLVFAKNQHANKHLYIISKAFHLPSCDIACIKVASLYRDFVTSLLPVL